MNRIQLADWNDTVRYCTEEKIANGTVTPQQELTLAVAERLDKLEAFVQSIARSQVIDDPELERYRLTATGCYLDELIDRARELMEELYEEE